MPTVQTKPEQVLPFTTGSAGMDSITRSIIIGISGAVTGIIIGFLNAHGFNDPNYTVMVGGAVFSAMAAIAGGVWGWYAQHRAKASVVRQVITAADTGIVPPSIAAEAVKIEAKAAGK